MGTSKIATVYHIRSAIIRAEIVRPGCPLTQWYKAQVDKPDILLNASLYDMETNEPKGTIIEAGKLVHNAGTGRGFGIKDGVIEIGTPWEGWQEYLTGFNCYVQAGRFVAPTWRDKYVFEQSLARIAIGKLGGEWCIVTGTGKLATGWNGRAYDTAGSFVTACLDAGITEIVGLDGGGSRALLWAGKWVYTSTRIPYNGIAIWLSKSEETDDMNVICKAKTGTYSADGTREQSHYIDANDACTISGIVADPEGALMAKITYPVGSGTRDAYIRDLDHFKQPK